MATDKDTLQPPSLAFTSFRSAVQSLRDHGLPPTVDRSAWNTRSGTEQTQIIATLKFFKLTDDKGATQDSLKELVSAAENGDTERTLWGKILRASYDKVFTFDLTNATPKNLEDAIGEYGVTGLAKERAIRFFLKAATHARIPLSTRLTVKLRDRSTAPEVEPSNGEASAQPKLPGKPRRKRRNAGVPPSAPPHEGNPPSQSNAMKTIRLPKVEGSLSIAGTFNAFHLMGEERDLVYKIIDLMTEYEQKSGPATE